MIRADEAKKIRLNVFSKFRFIIYLFLLNCYIVKNSSKGKYNLEFKEYFLMRIFFRKWDINNIEKLLINKGYRLTLVNGKRGITWE